MSDHFSAPLETPPISLDALRANIARGDNPVSALFWRLFAINGLFLAVGTTMLVITPVQVSIGVNPAEIPILIIGLGIILAANAFFVRRSLVKLEAQYIASGAIALAAQESERQRIARELHDEIGQSLTVALLSLRQVADRAPQHLQEETELAQQAVRTSLDDVRQVARRLRPGVLTDLGLQSALRELASDFVPMTGIAINRSLPKAIPVLGGDIELVIYRVAQEALTNVVRHAGATHADLSLKLDERTVTLRISDDGRGGDYEEGIGIRGMQERAALVDGDLTVTRNARGGTDVRLVVPLQNRNKSRP